METLEFLYASVAQSLEKSFDNAFLGLNATLALRDAKVSAAAEEKVRVAEDACTKASAEIEQLKVENTHLREELRRNDIGLVDAEVSVSESQFEETYAPQHVLGLSDYNDRSYSKRGTEETKTINEKYAALYGDAQTLMKAYKGLKLLIKRHKRKLEHWTEVTAVSGLPGSEPEEVFKSESMSKPLGNFPQCNETFEALGLDEVGSTVEMPTKGTIETYAGSQIGPLATIQLPSIQKPYSSQLMVM
ncbi:hypothetical protein BBP40_007102 [Aspergillus hancockii]|nr:hypothetical protein BBP40_007102 [Aspergillus hancockii]